MTDEEKSESLNQCEQQEDEEFIQQGILMGWLTLDDLIEAMRDAEDQLLIEIVMNSGVKIGEC